MRTGRNFCYFGRNLHRWWQALQWLLSGNKIILGELTDTGTRVILGHLLKPIRETAHALFRCRAHRGRSHRGSWIMAQTAKPDARFQVAVAAQVIENLQANLGLAVSQKSAKMDVLFSETPALQRGFA